MHDEHIYPGTRQSRPGDAGNPHAKGRLPARGLRLKKPDDNRDCGDFAGR
jgi:hypothetical protein